MDNQPQPGLEVLTAIPATQEAPKSAWQQAQEVGDVKVENAINKVRGMFGRAGEIGKGLLGLAVSKEARGALADEVGNKVYDAVESAAINVYIEVSKVETKVKGEWTKGVEAVKATVDATVETVKSKASEVYMEGLKGAAKWGAENVIPVVKGVVDAEGQVERAGFQIAAEMVDVVGRPFRAAGVRAESALRMPHNVVEGVVEGIANKPFTGGLSEKLKGVADMLGRWRGKAQEAYSVGFKLAGAANEIRTVFGKREEVRAGVQNKLDADAVNLKAGNI